MSRPRNESPEQRDKRLARQRAQRKIAKLVRENRIEELQQTPEAKAHRAAVERLEKPVEGKLGKAGWRRREFATIGAMWKAAAKLPAYAVSYTTARGKISETSPRDDQPGESRWRTLTSTAAPDFYDEETLEEARQTASLLFTTAPTRYALLWRRSKA